MGRDFLEEMAARAEAQDFHLIRQLQAVLVQLVKVTREVTRAQEVEVPAAVAQVAQVVSRQLEQV